MYNELVISMYLHEYIFILMHIYLTSVSDLGINTGGVIFKEILWNGTLPMIYCTGMPSIRLFTLPSREVS